MGVRPAGPASAGPAYEDPRARLCSTLERHAPVEGTLSADPKIAAAQQWRADSSLRSDAAWVAQVHRDHPEPPVWAHPVTPAEDADLKSHSGPAGEVWAKVNGYTARFPDTFAGTWIDQSARGRLTVAFTADLDDRRRELRQLFGSEVDVAVVRSVTTRAELSRLGDELLAWPETRRLVGTWVTRENLGVVEIGVFVRDEASVRAVADRFEGRPFCIDGPAPADIVPEGPQPRSGNGWRLLADQPKGKVWAVGAAQDRASYEQLWRQLGLEGRPPRVDFDRELVLHFGPAVSGSCSHVRLDAVVVDHEQRVVYPKVVLPGAKQRTCTMDAKPYTYLVAMQRSALPDDFTLQIEREPPRCPECMPEARTVVRQRR